MVETMVTLTGLADSASDEVGERTVHVDVTRVAAVVDVAAALYDDGTQTKIVLAAPEGPTTPAADDRLGMGGMRTLYIRENYETVMRLLASATADAFRLRAHK